MNKLQTLCNPNMTKEDFKKIYNYLETWQGRITKCVEKNKIIGYMVRFKSDLYKDVVYLHYHIVDLNNHNQRFEKSKAILSTMVGGDRYHDWCIKHDKTWNNTFERYKNIVSDDVYKYMNKFIEQANKYYKDNKKELIVF